MGIISIFEEPTSAMKGSISDESKRGKSRKIEPGGKPHGKLNRNGRRSAEVRRQKALGE
jgi:hypothetical protein